MIIHDPDNPYKDMFDEEIVMTVSDWYHDQMANLLPPFLSRSNPTGAEPVPQNALMNDTQNLTVSVQPGKTYLFRLINMAAFAGQYIWFEGHNMTIVEVDGEYTHPAEASMIYLATAQRCSFLLTTRNDTSANFPIQGSMDTVSIYQRSNRGVNVSGKTNVRWQTLFDTIPPGLNWNVTGWLVYDDTKPLPAPTPVDDFDWYDDMDLVPYDNQEILQDPDQQIVLDVIMKDLGDGSN